MLLPSTRGQAPPGDFALNREVRFIDTTSDKPTPLETFNSSFTHALTEPHNIRDVVAGEIGKLWPTLVDTLEAELNPPLSCPAMRGKDIAIIGEDEINAAKEAASNKEWRAARRALYEVATSEDFNLQQPIGALVLGKPVLLGREVPTIGFRLLPDIGFRLLPDEEPINATPSVEEGDRREAKPREDGIVTLYRQRKQALALMDETIKGFTPDTERVIELPVAVLDPHSAQLGFVEPLMTAAHDSYSAAILRHLTAANSESNERLNGLHALPATFFKL